MSSDSLLVLGLALFAVNIALLVYLAFTLKTQKKIEKWMRRV